MERLTMPQQYALQRLSTSVEQVLDEVDNAVSHRVPVSEFEGILEHAIRKIQQRLTQERS